MLAGLAGIRRAYIVSYWAEGSSGERWGERQETVFRLSLSNWTQIARIQQLSLSAFQKQKYYLKAQVQLLLPNPYFTHIVLVLLGLLLFIMKKKTSPSLCSNLLFKQCGQIRMHNPSYGKVAFFILARRWEMVAFGCIRPSVSLILLCYTVYKVLMFMHLVRMFY